MRSRTLRSRGDSLERVIGDINPTLRGWYGYFQHATPTVFRAIDGFVRRRLRAILRKQESGEPLPVRKPATGEPFAGEPHARFGGRGAAPFPIPVTLGAFRRPAQSRQPDGQQPH